MRTTRLLIAALAAIVCLAVPATAARQPMDFGSADAVLRWINGYRAKPDLASVPNAVRALSQFGAFKDPDNSGVYVGFIAGIIGANPAEADDLIAKMFPIPSEDQWAIVRAIAYSGVSEWKELLERQADRMPTRRVLIENYVSGKLPVLRDMAMPKDPTWFEKMRNYVDFSDKPKDKKKRLDPNADLLDTLWGYYFATGSPPPVARIITLLPMSKDRDHVEKLTIGSMAKFTLASNAARDAQLLAMLKRQSLRQPKETLMILNEVIEAAESVELGRMRKEALAAIEELKIKGPSSRRDMALWGQIGEGAIGVGCVTAAALGAVALGLPCIIGGASSTAALKYLSSPQ